MADLYSSLGDSLQFHNTALRIATLGDQVYQTKLIQAGKQISFGPPGIGEISPTDSMNLGFTVGFTVEDTLGLLRDLGCADDVPVDPPNFVPVEEQPMIIRQVGPTRARRDVSTQRIDTVWVRMIIDQTGVVAKAFIASSANELYNEIALAYAKSWKFNPATLENKPTAVWVWIPFFFIRS